MSSQEFQERILEVCESQVYYHKIILYYVTYKGIVFPLKGNIFYKTRTGAKKALIKQLISNHSNEKSVSSSSFLSFIKENFTSLSDKVTSLGAKSLTEHELEKIFNKVYLNLISKQIFEIKRLKPEERLCLNAWGDSTIVVE